MKRPVDIYEYMIEHKIGFNQASSIKEISEYFESNIWDFRMADKVFRVGLNYLKSTRNEKELDNLKHYYQNFYKRMKRKCFGEIEEAFTK